MLPPMQAYTVLQKCGAPRATYLIRTHAPTLTEAYTADFDRCTQVVLEHVVRHTLVGASRETEILAHLPPSDGGKGITRTSWIREGRRARPATPPRPTALPRRRRRRLC